MAGTVRILSIDGGGIRGLIPARVLAAIEARTGRPIAEHFHMIAGSSVGGILATGLAARGYKGQPLHTAAELADVFRLRGGEIFKASLARRITSGFGITDERYDADAFETVLRDTMGVHRLSDCAVDVLVPAYSLEARAPFFFKSWQARGVRLQPGASAADHDHLLWRVCRATAAAPTFFEPYRLPRLGEVPAGAPEYHALVDGSLIANDPTMCALASARRIYPDADDYFVLSLGTGKIQRAITLDDAASWGGIQWARPLISILINGAADVTAYHVREMATAMHAGTRYVRFQEEHDKRADDPTRYSDGFDDASPANVEALWRAADELIGRARKTSTRGAVDLGQLQAERAAQFEAIIDELSRPKGAIEAR